MIINQYNEKYFYDGQTYYIGEKVVGTKFSKYEGLFGVITEIRDGEDKDTENQSPDIYCNFDLPTMPCDIIKLERIFSKLYGRSKTVKDIVLDNVIMAPEMIKSLDKTDNYQKVYVITEDWAHKDKRGVNYIVVSSKEEANRQMRIIFNKELEEGFLSDQLEKEDFIVESYDHCYDAYLEGFAESEHYTLYYEEHNMYMDSEFLGLAYNLYRDNALREDFISQVKEIEEYKSLSDKEFQRIISDSSIPERIQSALTKNDAYFVAYYQTIKDVACNMLRPIGGME